MHKAIFFLMLTLPAFAIAADTDVTGFFPFFLTSIKNYGTLRKTITKSALSADEKISLLQPMADAPGTRRLPKLRFDKGVFVFSDKGKFIRLDPINPKQGLFKVNGKMVLLDAGKWQAAEAAMEKTLRPPDPARAAVIMMFASWYSCEKETCSNPWIGNLSSELRAEYKNQNPENRADINPTDRKPAQH